MSEPTNIPDANVEDAAVPGFPKTIKPYRRKLRSSALHVAQALQGVSDLPQEAQVKILTAVNAELRKMAGGAAKALEIAKDRDYEAYKAAKKAAIEGKLSKAEQEKFDSLISGLTGDGDYSWDASELDETGNEAMDKLQGDTEG